MAEMAIRTETLGSKNSGKLSSVNKVIFLMLPKNIKDVMNVPAYKPMFDIWGKGLQSMTEQSFTGV